MPDQWTEWRLGDLCTFTQGRSPTEKTPPGDYPLVVTAEGRRSSASYQFVGPTVCVPTISSTGHGHASLKRVHYQDGRFALANLLVALQLKVDEVAVPKYLWLLLDSQKDNLIVPLMRGTANVSFKPAWLADVKVTLPPLAEQRRILDLIDAVDTGREAAADAADASTLAYHSLLGELAEVAEQIVPVGDIVQVARAGGTPNRKRSDFFGGEIPWLKSGEVDNDWICETEEHITDAGLTGSAAWLLPPCSVVVAMYGATAGKVGFTGVELTTNQAVIGLRGREELISNRFLFHALRAASSAMKARATGAAQPNLSKERVLEQTIPLPPRVEQDDVVARLDSLLAYRSQLAHFSESLGRLRAALLPALLTGEHKIPDSYDTLLESMV